jgi:hypothetical protein
LKVMGRYSVQKVEVRADGTGLSSRAGTALLPLAAERLGLTDALGWALGETRERRSAHDSGRVFCDLAVMLADGGRCVSDLVALGSQSALFGVDEDVDGGRVGHAAPSVLNTVVQSFFMLTTVQPSCSAVARDFSAALV